MKRVYDFTKKEMPGREHLFVLFLIYYDRLSALCSVDLHKMAHRVINRVAPAHVGNYKVACGLVIPR